MSPTPVLQRGVVGVGYAFIKIKKHTSLASSLELRDSRRPFANLTNVRQYVFARKLAHLCALTICCTSLSRLSRAVHFNDWRLRHVKNVRLRRRA